VTLPVPAPLSIPPEVTAVPLPAPLAPFTMPAVATLPEALVLPVESLPVAPVEPLDPDAALVDGAGVLPPPQATPAASTSEPKRTDASFIEMLPCFG
jgi:hypothetical protein